MSDFFVSYAGADEKWAEWIAWTLEETGYTATLQKWDFRAGSNFVLEMERAAKEARRTVAVLSPDYLNSHFGAPEWAAAFGKDPEGMNRTLVPVRVRRCEIDGLRRPIVYIDLVGLDERIARETLLSGLKPGRGKPNSKPHFPGSAAPAFPGVAEQSGATSSSPVSSAGLQRRIPKIRGPITDRDRRRFASEGFGTIRQYFDDALNQLAAEHVRIEVDLSPVDTTKFKVEIFVDGQSRARAKIWQGGMFDSDGISYAEGSTADQNSAVNEVLSLSERDGELGFKATMNMAFGRADEGLDVEHLSAEAAAEYLWRRFTWGLDR